MNKRQRVAVFLGGPSSEHDVSLKTGTLMLRRLDRQRFEPAPVFVDRERVWHFAKLPYEGGALEAALVGGGTFRPNTAERLPWQPELALLGLHGIYGEDGQIQAELAALGIRYTGSGPEASRRAMNKLAAKEVFRTAKLPLAPDFTLAPRETGAPAATRRARTHPGPGVAKPWDGGSSVGVRIVESGDALARALDEVAQDGPVIIEPLVAGRELTCGVLEDPATGVTQALPPTEIVPKSSTFFDFGAKYTVGGSEEITPARLSLPETQRVQEVALAAHAALGCRGYSRSDFILSKTEGPILLETNTLPGMTETSLLPQEAAAIGISYPELLTRLLAMAHL